MDLATPYAGYVFAAFGLSFVVLAGLCFWVIVRDRANRRKSGDLK
jgi:heme exporter protein CcmD